MIPVVFRLNVYVAVRLSVDFFSSDLCGIFLCIYLFMTVTAPQFCCCSNITLSRHSDCPGCVSVCT